MPTDKILPRKLTALAEVRFVCDSLRFCYTDLQTRGVCYIYLLQVISYKTVKLSANLASARTCMAVTKSQKIPQDASDIVRYGAGLVAARLFQTVGPTEMWTNGGWSL